MHTKTTPTPEEFEEAMQLCADEPVHIPGTIQPFGALLAYETESGIVRYCAENLAEMIGFAPTDVFGRNIAELLGAELSHKLNNAQIAMAGSAARVYAATLPLQGKQCDFHAFHSAEFTVLEIEECDAELLPTSALMQDVHQLIEAMRSASDETKMMQQTTDLLRIVTGFDRVMAYRFDTEFNGNVIAESRRSSLEPMLGLRFPKWDIPEQARAIMKQVPLRFICDVDQTPVALLAETNAADPLDITHANMRGVSPVHMQYLRNMGTQATMTLSLVVDDALWGIVSFHHSTPRVPTNRIRQICLAFLPVLQSKLSLIIRENALALARSLDELRERTHLEFRPDLSITDTLKEIGPALLKNLNADGVCLLSGDELHGFGTHVGQQEMEALSTIAAVQDGAIYTSDDLPENLRRGTTSGNAPSASAGTDCTGTITISLEKDLTFAVFRRPLRQQVKWAGAPGKVLDKSDGQLRLSPRGSFSLFLEEVTDRSEPWTQNNVYLFQAVATTVQAALAKRTATETFARQQELMVHELNHRVKNILSLIRSISREARRENASLKSYGAALEMRINALAAAHEIGLGSPAEAVSVFRLIDIESAPYTTDESRVSVKGADCFLHAEFAPIFGLVIHELMTNAVKYGALKHPEGRIDITLAHERGGLTLTWNETGVPHLYEPNRKGFGTTLISNAIPYELGGEASLEFRESGVQAVFWLPPTVIDLVALKGDMAASKSGSTKSSVQPGSKRLNSVLIVEDNFMIASEMVMLLELLNIPNIDTVSNVTDARDFIDAQVPDAAILDINLGSHRQTSEVIATHLQQIGVPFIFVTGYGDLTELPESFADVPVLKKPVSQDKLGDAVEWLLDEFKAKAK